MVLATWFISPYGQPEGLSVSVVKPYLDSHLQALPGVLK